MPGQEKMVMEYYQKNPSATASLRGTIYEDKILNLIKEKAKSNLKSISKAEAEKLLKSAHDHEHKHSDDHSHKDISEKKTKSTKKTTPVKKGITTSKKPTKTKKVSKK